MGLDQKTFDLQPTLVGELVILRPLMNSDFEELFKCASDPKIWEQHPHKERYRREVFEKFFTEGMESGGAFAILDKQTGAMIGSSRYYEYKPELNQITIGYTFLIRERWGGRFNKELKALMLKHAFQFVDAVIFEIGANNRRSRIAIERTGARLVGAADLDQSSHVIYRLKRDEFPLSVGP